jgi:hypothetical protein
MRSAGGMLHNLLQGTLESSSSNPSSMYRAILSMVYSLLQDLQRRYVRRQVLIKESPSPQAGQQATFFSM